MTGSSQTADGALPVPGGLLSFDVTGDGRPVVLAHAGIADRRMWDDVVPALARTRRVIRYDARGYGRTVTTEPVPYSNRQDIVDLLDHLGIDRAALVGASRAGTITLDTAIEFPSRVAAVVSVAGGISGFDGGETEVEADAFREVDRLEEARDWEQLVAREMELWVDGLGQGRDRVPEVRRRVAEMDLEAYRHHADEPLDGVLPLRPPAVDRLGEVRVPVLAIVGTLDTSGTLAAAGTIASEIAGARLVELPGVAHMVSMEVASRFIEIVESFLDEVGA